jgi:hypothetical protein
MSCAVALDPAERLTAIASSNGTQNALILPNMDASILRAHPDLGTRNNFRDDATADVSKID